MSKRKDIPIGGVGGNAVFVTAHGIEITTFPTLRRASKAWLMSNAMSDEETQQFIEFLQRAIAVRRDQRARRAKLRKSR